MKINKTVLGLTLFSLAATIVIYQQLPDRIPIHWNIRGEIDRYGGRMFTLFTGALPLLMFILMHIAPKIDPRRESYEKHMGPYRTIVTMLIFFFIGIHWAAIGYALGYSIDISFFVKLGIGLVFLITGNYLPVIKRNYTLGIRVPWTLTDEIVWEKTHHAAGYIFVFLGLIWLALAFIHTPEVFYILIAALLLALALIVGYSYALSMRRRKG